MPDKASFTKTLISLLLLTLSLASIAAADVVWSDEFDGTTIDRDKWTFDVGTGSWGWGNGELECYTARSENAYIENGALVIQAKRENYSGSSFTSARLKTIGRMAFTYGTLEARVKIPNLANGLWPAFWLLGENIGTHPWPSCGEIDIMEMGMTEAIANGTQNRRHNSGVFWDHYGNLANYAEQVEAPANLNNDYHIYKMEWTPTAITTYVDDVKAYEISIAQNDSTSLEEFHRPMYVLLNLAVGGQNFVNITDPAAITAPFPAKMYIDWIRLSDNGHTQLRAKTEEHGNFGIFTETTSVTNKVNYGSDANLYIWNNMTATSGSALEGSQLWSFNTAANIWWGMGVACSTDRNMKNYSDGYLHLNMKFADNQPFRIGIKSTHAGESWLTIKTDDEQFGLVRDNNWHEMLIPLNRFDNIDFNTINQIFMIASDGGSASNIAIDNVYWIETASRPTPANGSYGLYTETPAHKTTGKFSLGSDGDFYVWENTLTSLDRTAKEGSSSLAYKSAPGLGWFGAAFTANVKLDLSAFRYPDSYLHFAMKTTSTATFQIGMKSGNVQDIGQKWITFTSGSDPYGFARDGSWHDINIPMSQFAADVDLTQVSQIFELLGTAGAIGEFQIDDIYFFNGHIPAIDTPGDTNRDSQVNIIDLDTIANYWLYSNCNMANNHCDGADLNYDGQITLTDFTTLSANWQN